MKQRILAAMAAATLATILGAFARGRKTEAPAPRPDRLSRDGPQAQGDECTELANDTYELADAMAERRLGRLASQGSVDDGDGLRAYEAVVSFRSNGDEFATDTVKVRAKDNPSARAAAIQAAEDSRFHDVRVPDLSRKVLSCKLAR